MKLLLLFTIFTLTFAKDEALQIFFFKVGQADSQLILFPSGYSILIDAGDYDYDGASNTKHVAKRLEEILGHKTIDVFILTHYHVDHAGYVGHNGIWYLIEKAGFTFKKFLKRNAGYYHGSNINNCKMSTLLWKYAGEMCSEMADAVCYASATKDKTKLSKIAENAHRCSKTQIAPPDEGAKVTVLMRDALGVKSKDSGNVLSRDSVNDNPSVAENDFSVCLKVEYYNFTYATCGDMSGNTIDDGGRKFHDVESFVAPMMGEVDLLKAGHHGSHTATNELWANTLKPTVSIITCGQSMNLPHTKPLQILKGVGSTIYSTSKNCNQGAIEAAGGINQFGSDIIITVTKGRETFKVSNEDGSITKTFKIKQNKPPVEECKFLEY